MGRKHSGDLVAEYCPPAWEETVAIVHWWTPNLEGLRAMHLTFLAEIRSRGSFVTDRIEQVGHFRYLVNTVWFQNIFTGFF